MFLFQKAKSYLGDPIYACFSMFLHYQAYHFCCESLCARVINWTRPELGGLSILSGKCTENFLCWEQWSVEGCSVQEAFSWSRCRKNFRHVKNRKFMEIGLLFSIINAWPSQRSLLSLRCDRIVSGLVSRRTLLGPGVCRCSTLPSFCCRGKKIAYTG